MFPGSSAALMATPKKKPKGRPTNPLRAPGPGRARDGSLRDWINRGARHCRLDVAKLIDLAVISYLHEQGFTEPPPER